MTAKPYLHKVLYRDCDMMGVVNNANYVHFMEDARVDALSQIGCEYKGMEERGFAGPVIRLSVEYKSSARFGDEMEVVVTFSAMLELLKFQYIFVSQKDAFEEIYIEKNPDYVDVFIPSEEEGESVNG